MSMTNMLAVSTLQTLVAFVRNHRIALVSNLEAKLDVWSGKNAWVDVNPEITAYVTDTFPELKSNVSVKCRVITSYRDAGPEESRFTLHLCDNNTGALMNTAYVACGKLFGEQAPPVIVRKAQRSFV